MAKKLSEGKLRTNIKPVYTTCLGSKRRPTNPQVAIFSLLIDWARSRGRKDLPSPPSESKGFLLNKLWATLCGNEKGSSRIYFCMRRIVKKFGSTQLGVGARGKGGESKWKVIEKPAKLLHSLRRIVFDSIYRLVVAFSISNSFSFPHSIFSCLPKHIYSFCLAEDEVEKKRNHKQNKRTKNKKTSNKKKIFACQRKT